VQFDTDALPNDPIVLQQILRDLYTEKNKLRPLIDRLTRHQFGRRSEQLAVEQLLLGLEDQEQTIAEHQAARTQPSRQMLPKRDLAPRAITPRCRRICRVIRW
jgi:hypothetical protein